MVRGLVETLEKHHNVRILDEAVSEAVRLSARYIPSRQLPDKAVSLIDTACARVGDEPGGGAAAARGPPAADRADRYRGRHPGPRDRRRRAASARGARSCWRERAKLAQELDRARGALGAGEGAWRPRSARRARRSRIPANTEDKDALRAKLTGTSAKLRELQGETPLIFPVVDRQAVAEVVAGWTGIPIGRMQSNEIRTVLNLQGGDGAAHRRPAARAGRRGAGDPHRRAQD